MRKVIAIVLILAGTFAIANVGSDAFGLASATTVVYDPVPDPTAAGWTQEGSGSVQIGSPLGLTDPNNAPGAGLNFFVADSALFSGGFTLKTRLTIAQFGQTPAADGNTGIHVTINDGTKMVRAYVLNVLGSYKVALAAAGGGYSHGFTFSSITLEFTIRLNSDGTGSLLVANPTPGGAPLEEVTLRADLADSLRPNTKSLEFGSAANIQAANSAAWETLGLPRLSQLCHDPVPNPMTAGWAQDGTSGVVQIGTPLGITDPSNAPGAGLTFYCSDPSIFGGPIILTPRLTMAQFGQTTAPDGNTGVHVTINDGTRMVRAYVLSVAGSYKVALALDGGGYSNGFTFGGTTIDFTVRMNADGSGSLLVANPTVDSPPLEESTQRSLLAGSSRPGTKTLEFGSAAEVGASNSAAWDTLGLAQRNLFSAEVQPPINADGTSSFNARRGVVPLKFTLTENGTPTCILPPATLRVSRIAGTTATPVDESLYTASLDAGPEFRIADCVYHYKLDPRPLGPGRYLAEILIDGDVVGAARFELR